MYTKRHVVYPDKHTAQTCLSEKCKKIIHNNLKTIISCMNHSQRVTDYLKWFWCYLATGNKLILSEPVNLNCADKI